MVPEVLIEVTRYPAPAYEPGAHWSASKKKGSDITWLTIGTCITRYRLNICMQLLQLLSACYSNHPLLIVPEENMVDRIDAILDANVDWSDAGLLPPL